jgi:hypothetical protein
VARTYGLIGTRPDLGGVLARAHLAELWASTTEGTTWGLGFFEKDEVLLKRGPSGPQSRLFRQVKQIRSHAFLAHECTGEHGTPNTEHMPPLRYGHLLFSCQGVVGRAELLMNPVKELLPEFLTRSLRGETFTELVFALFLSGLPAGSLGRSRLREPGGSVDPLGGTDLAKALRKSLETLDELCEKHGLGRFGGDLWIHTGEILMIAHRGGHLGLQVIRGKEDLARLSPLDETPPPGLEQGHFVALTAAVDPPSPKWERLQENVLLTAPRGKTPQTESL